MDKILLKSLHKKTEQLNHIRKLTRKLLKEIHELKRTIKIYEEDITKKEKKIKNLEKTIKQLRRNQYKNKTMNPTKKRVRGKTYL